ncbi:MAG: hypothetical protein WC872_00005, partial [Candidatus Absconditabacterales bacterium]
RYIHFVVLYKYINFYMNFVIKCSYLIWFSYDGICINYDAKDDLFINPKHIMTTDETTTEEVVATDTEATTEETTPEATEEVAV